MRVLGAVDCGLLFQSQQVTAAHGHASLLASCLLVDYHYCTTTTQAASQTAISQPLHTAALRNTHIATTPPGTSTWVDPDRDLYDHACSWEQEYGVVFQLRRERWWHAGVPSSWRSMMGGGMKILGSGRMEWGAGDGGAGHGTRETRAQSQGTGEQETSEANDLGSLAGRRGTQDARDLGVASGRREEW